MLLTILVFGQMPKMYLHYSRDVKRLLEKEKSQPLHGSNLVKNLTLKIGSRSCSKMRKILLPWCSNTSTLKMLDFTLALLQHQQEKYHARPSLLLTGESLKCLRYDYSIFSTSFVSQKISDCTYHWYTDMILFST